ncbi:MAG: SCO family protein [Legionella sp.]|jgi:protein SCO1/2
MYSKNKGVSLTVALLLAFVGLFFGIFIMQHVPFKKEIDASQFHGAYLAEPKAIREFNLLGIDNKPFSNAQLQGHWTIVFFGFTQCASVCPITMAELSKMYRMLENKDVKNLPQVVLISIDPDRDSLEKLEQYVHAFHPSFYAAKGDELDVQLLAREMGITFEKVPNKNSVDPRAYDVQHSGAVLVFNPEGELNALFTPPHSADLLVKDYVVLSS